MAMGEGEEDAGAASVRGAGGGGGGKGGAGGGVDGGLWGGGWGNVGGRKAITAADRICSTRLAVLPVVLPAEPGITAGVGSGTRSRSTLEVGS